MDAFYEEDDRILGHAADPYHRIDRNLDIGEAGALTAVPAGAS